MNHITYTRVLLKLSGEQLRGERPGELNIDRINWLAAEIKKVTALGVEVVIVAGGGNLVRGRDLASKGIKKITAHYMGMLGTMMNNLALGDLLNTAGVPAHVLSNVWAEQVVDSFTPRRAIHHLKKGRVVLVAGGTGKPYVTTDTAAVSLALELDCDIVCKLTKVDGVYDKDPFKHADAERFDTLGIGQAVADTDVSVMDKAALGLAMEEKKPILVLDMLAEDNILRAVRGEKVGTLIS